LTGHRKEYTSFLRLFVSKILLILEWPNFVTLRKQTKIVNKTIYHPIVTITYWDFYWKRTPIHTLKSHRWKINRPSWMRPYFVIARAMQISQQPETCFYFDHVTFIHYKCKQSRRQHLEYDLFSLMGIRKPFFRLVKYYTKICEINNILLFSINKVPTVMLSWKKITQPGKFNSTNSLRKKSTHISRDFIKTNMVTK